VNPLLACGALWTSLLPDPMGGPPPGDCLAVGAEVAGRFERHWPDGGVDRALTMPRSRLALGIEQGEAGARFVLGTVRSGGDSSYIGVDGEALVPRVEVAEARVQVPRLGLLLSGGLVDDPWVVSSNLAWTHRASAPGFAEEHGWQDRSDIGGLAAWTAPDGWATVAFTSTTGEGLARRERNTGLDSSVLVLVRPLTASELPEALEVAFYGRDGSRGLGLAQNHRLGARLSSTVGPVQGAVEHLRALGVGGDSLREPRGTSAWLAAAPGLPVVGFLRYDRLDESADFENDVTKVVRAGAGLPLPSDVDRPTARLMLLAEQRTTDPAVTEVAGARSERQQMMLGLQLDVNLQGAVPLSPIDPLTRP